MLCFGLKFCSPICKRKKRAKSKEFLQKHLRCFGIVLQTQEKSKAFEALKFRVQNQQKGKKHETFTEYIAIIYHFAMVAFKVNS